MSSSKPSTSIFGRIAEWFTAIVASVVTTRLKTAALLEHTDLKAELLRRASQAETEGHDELAHELREQVRGFQLEQPGKLPSDLVEHLTVDAEPIPAGSPVLNGPDEIDWSGQQPVEDECPKPASKRGRRKRRLPSSD